MTLEAWFQLVEAVSVLIAVGFAIVQVRQHRRNQHREAALELLHSFQTPEFARALTLVYAMPEGLSKEEVERRLGDEIHLVYAMTTTWESIGVLWFQWLAERLQDIESVTPPVPAHIAHRDWQPRLQRGS